MILPSFDKCSLVDGCGECTSTILWLRNPESTFIVLGYNSRSNKDSLSSDSIVASVQYQLEGEELDRRLSHNVQYRCQSVDACNNRTNMKNILHSLHIEESFPGRFDSMIAANRSFNKQSIRQCYFNRTSNPCLPVDYADCQRCEIAVDFSNSAVNSICATCPTKTANFNSIKRNAIFIPSNRSQVLDRIRLSCQTGEHCNSMENVYQIRQYSSINFDFNKFFIPYHSNSVV